MDTIAKTNRRQNQLVTRLVNWTIGWTDVVQVTFGQIVGCRSLRNVTRKENERHEEEPIQVSRFRCFVAQRCNGKRVTKYVGIWLCERPTLNASLHSRWFRSTDLHCCLLPKQVDWSERWTIVDDGETCKSRHIWTRHMHTKGKESVRFGRIRSG